MLNPNCISHTSLGFKIILSAPFQKSLEKLIIETKNMAINSKLKTESQISF
jgi:hypothetical protein